MGRRILNRKELRADAEAAEKRKGEDEEEKDEDEDDEDEDEEDDEESPAEAEEEEADEGDDEDAVAAKPKKKKAAKAAKPAAKPRSRSRVAKVTRLRLVWGVFSNSNQCVATYEYPRRKDAEGHAAKLTTDKKSTHFVQPVKEPIEEKKEKE